MKEQYKWDFKDFFLSDEDFLDSFERLKKEIVDFKKDYEKFSIEERLSKYYALSLLGERLVSYSELHSDLDLKNETYLSYKNEVYTEKNKDRQYKRKHKRRNIKNRIVFRRIYEE